MKSGIKTQKQIKQLLTQENVEYKPFFMQLISPWDEKQHQQDFNLLPKSHFTNKINQFQSKQYSKLKKTSKRVKTQIQDYSNSFLFEKNTQRESKKLNFSPYYTPQGYETKLENPIKVLQKSKKKQLNRTNYSTSIINLNDICLKQKISRTQQISPFSYKKSYLKNFNSKNTNKSIDLNKKDTLKSKIINSQLRGIQKKERKNHKSCDSFRKKSKLNFQRFYGSHDTIMENLLKLTLAEKQFPIKRNFKSRSLNKFTVTLY